MYRPERWENPYWTTEFTGHYQLDADLLAKAEKAKVYEAGADAMLEALRRNGIPMKPGDKFFSYGKDLGNGFKGIIVFIPNEEG